MCDLWVALGLRLMTCFAARNYHNLKDILLNTMGGCGLCGKSCHLVLGFVCVPVQVVPSCGNSLPIVLGPVAVRYCRLVLVGLFHCLRLGCLADMLSPVCILPGTMWNGVTL